MIFLLHPVKDEKFQFAMAPLSTKGQGFLILGELDPNGRGRLRGCPVGRVLTPLDDCSRVRVLTDKRAFLRGLAHSVVARIRAGMLAIGLLVAILVGAGSLGLSQIERQNRVLLDQAVPNLIQAEHLNSNVADLSALLLGVPELRDGEAIAGAESRIDAILSVLHDRVDADQRISVLLNDLDASAALTLSQARNLLDQQAAVQARIDDAEALRAAMMRQTFEALLAAGIRLDDRGALPPEMAAAENTRDIALILPVMRARLGLESLGDLISALSVADTAEALQAAEARFAGQADLLAVLIEVTPGMSELGIGTGLARLGTLTLGPAGLAALQRDVIDTAGDLRRARRRQELLLRLVSEEAAALMGSARSGIVIAGRENRAAIGDLMSTLRFVGIAVLAILLGIAFLVVERQIAHRLARLVTAVRRIAGGEIDCTVGVGGRDELAAMAEALEIFKANSRELQRSNADLARFAYAASHDLRAPLGAIRDLAAWTLDDGGDDLPRGCRKNLELLQRRVQRLSTLMDQLLEYSEAGQDSVGFEETDIGAMARGIMARAAPEGGFDVVLVAPSPVIVTYAGPLSQVLGQLLVNAVDHHDREAGIVRLEVAPDEDRVRLRLGDDGPGIPPQCHARIFELFQVLHGPSDSAEAGPGMGLAIARKLVERFGGRIAVVSDPATGRGTTFEFDWPQQALSMAPRLAA